MKQGLLIFMILVLCAVGASAQLVVVTTEVEFVRSYCNPENLLGIPTIMRAEGGSGDYEWRIIGGRVPPDTKLHRSGKWSGDPPRSWFRNNPDATADIEVYDVQSGRAGFGTVQYDDHIQRDFEGYCANNPWGCAGAHTSDTPWLLAVILAGVALAARVRARA